MFAATSASLPSVLIVENENGEVYIIEDKDSKSQVEKILKTEKCRNESAKPANKSRSPAAEV